jgi:hypothetical protein
MNAQAPTVAPTARRIHRHKHRVGQEAQFQAGRRTAFDAAFDAGWDAAFRLAFDAGWDAAWEAATNAPAEPVEPGEGDPGHGG